MGDSIYKIALNLLPNVGALLARRLVSYTGSAEAVFTDSKKALSKIPGIGSSLISSITNKNILNKAEEELKSMDEKGIRFLFYLDSDYPQRLNQCEDAPVVLYVKGNFNTNPQYSLSIVGTRKPTESGKELCANLVSDLSDSVPNIQIISGLAYGIDIAAHKAALLKSLDTVAVLGHGLHMIYPASHKYISNQIIDNGALVTEFSTSKKPDPGNFVSRNRIIAGLADATVVVESAKKGGALITADVAFSYNREVFAIPGRIQDKYSSGCNALIKQNKAALLENAEDIIQLMNWDIKQKNRPQQQSLFEQLIPEEKLLVDILKETDQLSLDDLVLRSENPLHIIKTHLLNLEFKGLVKSMPGNAFKLIS